MKTITRSGAMVLGLVVTLAACHGASPTLRDSAAYSPPSARLEGVTHEALMDAVVRNAREQSWSILSVNRQHGTVDALAMMEQTGEMAMRERWRFVVQAGSVTVARTLEVRFSEKDTRWQRVPDVSKQYGYARENAQLNRISLDVLERPRFHG
jgi:hypothetical protein